MSTLRVSLIIALSFSLLLSFPCITTVFAQTQTPLEKRQAVKERVAEKRENLKEKLESRREEAKEKAKAKREELKLKIQTIKDEKKKAVVERLDAKLADVNKRRTDQMSQNLEKLTEVLEKISSKTADAKAQGKDTATVDLAITNAQNAIDTATTAVTTQAGKEYVITVETESTLRNTVGQTTSQMQSDLRATHTSVVNAKQAVQNAAQELRKAPGTTTQ